MGKRSCLNQILHLKLNLNIELNAYQNFIDWKSTMSFCHVCAMPADEVRLLPSACEICIESGTKCLSILWPWPSLSSWLCFIIFYFFAFILKYILSLLSSLSVLYFPISYLNRFPFEVLKFLGK